MYNVKSVQVLLYLLLAAGPSTALTVPIAKNQDPVRSQMSSATESGSNTNMGIPDGPYFNATDSYSHHYQEGPSSNGGNPDITSHTHSDDSTNIGIPGGPYFNAGRFEDETCQDSAELEPDRSRTRTSIRARAGTYPTSFPQESSSVDSQPTETPAPPLTTVSTPPMPPTGIPEESTPVPEEQEGDECPEESETAVEGPPQDTCSCA